LRDENKFYYSGVKDGGAVAKRLLRGVIGSHPELGGEPRVPHAGDRGVAPPLPSTHNGGPPLEDPPEHVPEWGDDGGAAEYFQWKAAIRRSRRNAPHDIVMFRLSRAEAAGVDYETYVTELLERGRRLQEGDDVEALKQRWKTRGVAKVKPL
jgi:hypothetical protein